MRYTFDTEEVKNITLGQVGTFAGRTPVYAVKATAGLLGFAVKAVGLLAGGLAQVADATAKSLDKK